MTIPQTIKWFQPKVRWLTLLGLAIWLAPAPAARAQTRPYIGYTYPAGGQQGTTFQIKLGGQGLDGVDAVLITGSGVKAQVLEYHRRLNNEEIQLLNQQLKALKQATTAVASAMVPVMTSETAMMMSKTSPEKTAAGSGQDAATRTLMAKIEKRTGEFVQTPACASISSLVFVEVTIASNAEPGVRELRLATPRGVSNPLVFHVGQLPEFARKPMITATIQTLGKEAQALRKRPADEVEDRITLPCTVNGQIASGEVNRYRFTARQGQRLVLSTQGRELIPFIADAVPGWFQPVLALYDGKGKELAFADGYRFKPDPVILYEVPQDGEYVCAISDSIYRGREDFVYRITLGELPFLTSIFPLGGQAGAPMKPAMKGWNVEEAELTTPPKGAGPGTYALTASKKGFVSNPVAFALDKLPDVLEAQTNHTQASAQKIMLPLIVNGRIEQPGEWDVFHFDGKSNQTVVAEVEARRLDSPLDSVIKLTDATGKLLAFNDDREDLGAGVNTHHADSYFMVRLPADGACYVHIGDTARKGGEEYAYRLRVSEPQPDFALRAVPSSVSFRSNSTVAVSLYAIRQDGFAGPIKLSLKDPPAGFSAAPVTLSGTQAVARLTIKTSLMATKEPVSLSIVGRAKVGDKEITREAVPAEDRMQAFLWRHLVPASDLKAIVFDPSYQPPPKRVPPPRPVSALTNNAAVGTNLVVGTNAVTGTNVAVAANMVVRTNVAARTNLLAGTNLVVGPNIAVGTNLAVGTNVVVAAKPKFTKQQIAGRVRQLNLLYEEGLLTDAFYDLKVSELEAAQ